MYQFSVLVDFEEYRVTVRHLEHEASFSIHVLEADAKRPSQRSDYIEQHLREHLHMGKTIVPERLVRMIAALGGY